MVDGTVKITVTVEETDQLIPVDLSSDLALQDFKAYISAETDIEPQDQVLILNGKELAGDDKTLEQLNFTDNEVVVVRNKKSANSNAQSQAQPAGSGNFDPTEQMRQQILNDPEARRQLLAMNPGVENVLNDPVQFKEVVSASLQNQQRRYPGNVSQNEWLALQRDPDNPDNQRRILELIEMDQIEENLQHAYEQTPESFASVTMLYINLEVNGHPIKAFVDSGAQTTIISTRLARECNIARLIDKRYQGEAHGVGKTAILGRIHSVPLKIEDQFIPCSFTVLDTGVDMLLGLDMLKRHQANIDLKNNVLAIADVTTPFLGEADIPPSIIAAGSIGQQLGTGINNTTGTLPSSNPQTSGVKRQPPNVAAANAAKLRNNQTSTQSTPNFDEDKISNLIGLGFSRDQVLRALTQAGGNAEVAASILFS